MLILSPTRWLSSVDLPTFGRPTIATWPQQNAGTAFDSAKRTLDARRDANPRIGLLRRRLFGSAAARAGSGRHKVQRRHPALDSERLRVCFAGNVDHDSIPARRSPRLQPFLQPRFRILAECCRVEAMELPAYRLMITCCAASKPPSINTAPNIASTASAKIDARIAPPLFCSPSPKRSAAPRSRFLATRARCRGSRASREPVTGRLPGFAESAQTMSAR